MPRTAGPALDWKIEVDGDDHPALRRRRATSSASTDPTYREGYFGFWTYCNTTRGRDRQPGHRRRLHAPDGLLHRDSGDGGRAARGRLRRVGLHGQRGGSSRTPGTSATAATGTGAQATHTYAAVGAYTVVLTVADAAGNVGTATKVITVTDDCAPGGLVHRDSGDGARAARGRLRRLGLHGRRGDRLVRLGLRRPRDRDGSPDDAHLRAQGTCTAVLTVADAAGNTGTAEKVITVEAAGGTQKPMDFNQDGNYDISDPTALLNHLFLGGAAPPCADNSVEHPANIALLDANGDGAIDISDAIHALGFLFLGGQRPSMCLDDECPCILIVDCPDNASCP